MVMARMSELGILLFNIMFQRALAHEVLHVVRPGSRITGEMRHVDGGYHIMV